MYILKINTYILELNSQTFFSQGMCNPKSLDVSGLEQPLSKNINVPWNGITGPGVKKGSKISHHIGVGNVAHENSGFVTVNVH